MNLKSSYNYVLDKFDQNNFLLWLGITLVIFLIIDPVTTSLFTGSAWRNTQTYAALDCFRSSLDFKGGVQCFFAPTLGFDNKHYVGLELPVLPLIDYGFHSTINVWTVVSRGQLLSISMLLASFLILMRISFFSISTALLLLVAYYDNPTLDFFINSYQPDLLSIALIASAISLMVKDSSNKSYIPEIILAIGIIIKPQHAIISYFAFIYLRANNLKIKNIFLQDNGDLIIRSFLVAAPVFLTLAINQLVIFLGIGEKYPNITGVIGGLEQFGAQMAFNYFVQFFESNGYEFLFITALLLVIAMLLDAKEDIFNNKNIFVFFVTTLTGYILTYCIFLTGFLVNVYYGSVLLLTVTLSMLLVMKIISDFSYTNISLRILNSIKLITLLSILLSVIFLARPQEFYAKLLTDRKAVCLPGNIRAWVDDNNITNIFLNSPSLEPTARTSVGKGVNLWHANLSSIDYSAYPYNESDVYYLSCAYFTEMLRNDVNSFASLNKNWDLVEEVDDWSIWRRKK